MWRYLARCKPPVGHREHQPEEVACPRLEASGGEGEIGLHAGEA